MERYIGLDVHATSCTAAVIDGQGKRLPSLVRRFQQLTQLAAEGAQRRSDPAGEEAACEGLSRAAFAPAIRSSSDHARRVA